MQTGTWCLYSTVTCAPDVTAALLFSDLANFFELDVLKKLLT